MYTCKYCMYNLRHQYLVAEAAGVVQCSTIILKQPTINPPEDSFSSAFVKVEEFRSSKHYSEKLLIMPGQTLCTNVIKPLS